MADNNDHEGDVPSDKKTPTDDAFIPEVEAEIVDEGDALKGATPEVDLQGSNSETEPDPDPSPDTDPASRPSTLTPGVILFIVFSVIALALFFVWRGQAASVVSSKADQEISVPATSAESDENIPDTDEVAEVVVEAKEPDAEDAAEKDISRPVIEDAKISNGRADIPREEIEKPLETAPVSEVVPEDASENAGSETYLPPLPDTSGLAEKITNEEPPVALPAVEDESEVSTDAAISKFDPETTIQAEDQSGDEENEPLVADDEADAATVEGQNEVEISAAAEEGPSQLTTTSALTAEQEEKIANDIDGLRQALNAETDRLTEALEEERNLTQSLQDEIRQMREDFDAALAVRDARSSDEIAAMRAELNKIQNVGGVSPARLAAGAVAFSALQRAVNSGAPYKAELDILARLSPDSEPIDILRGYAETGAPSLEMLQETFPVAAREALKAAGQSEANSLWGRLGARAANLVSVRPAEPRSGDTPGAIISRAENAVHNDEIEVALRELSALPQISDGAMSEWIVNARARTNLIAASNTLSRVFTDPAAE